MLLLLNNLFAFLLIFYHVAIFLTECDLFETIKDHKNQHGAPVDDKALLFMFMGKCSLK